MIPRAWTIKALLKVSADYLKKKQIDNPRLTAEVLLAHQLESDRVNLYLNLDQPLTEKEVSGYRALIKRRLGREPLQYITGMQEFWSLDFIVDARALIPRPETELLVEHALRLLKPLAESENQEPKILDLGTGCGTLAVSLAKEVQNTQIWATDNSHGALELARLNAERNGVSDRIEFKKGDLWEPLMNLGIKFDIILSNPPYVASGEYNDLPPEVRDYEPRSALDGGDGGMYYIERILTKAPDYMKPKAWIMLEMSPDQTEKALGLVEKIEGYSDQARIRDYSRLYRIVMAQRA
ncbi:MAG: peptide chain release factor N(5)-glutamine methyltransferase [Deltaproteobacteria bacterium]|nr:peptide chain release factor N(5)-glutamine methyltransferase [Deltaproteobacteria bacterium]MBW2116580.1 peptide chain release factor N(5)-glutamine methyltransferase [Deltaproteobacteria bacterium]MBW2344443.1 peptide chain release factor N(5)-glutamine methyltransferase [Deltaproteobacteria bacterium]